MKKYKCWVHGMKKIPYSTHANLILNHKNCPIRPRSYVIDIYVICGRGRPMAILDTETGENRGHS